MSTGPTPGQLAELLRDTNSVLARYPIVATPNQLRAILERLRDAVVLLRDTVHPPEHRGTT